MNGQTEKTVTLPASAEEIILRLTAVCDEHNMVERLYTEVARYAGQELLPQGIVVMLTLAVYDFGQQYPPPVSSITGLFIPRWIDALVDDKEVAEAAKQWLKQVEAVAEAERKANYKRKGE